MFSRGNQAFSVRVPHNYGSDQDPKIASQEPEHGHVSRARHLLFMSRDKKMA